MLCAIPNWVSQIHITVPICLHKISIYKGADKSLAQPGRKQANVSVRMA